MTLGNFATKLLVPTEVGITRMRGRRIDWWLGATLVPTFHPAAALRGRPEVRADMKEDFSLVAEVLDDEEALVEISGVELGRARQLTPSGHAAARMPS